MRSRRRSSARRRPGRGKRGCLRKDQSKGLAPLAADRSWSCVSKGGQPREEATKAFDNALEQDPRYEPAHHNLGVVKTLWGELPEARGHFEKAGEVAESKAFVSAIDTALEANDYEAEPNSDAAHANPLPLEKKLAGNIPDNNDTAIRRVRTWNTLSRPHPNRFFSSKSMDAVPPEDAMS